MTVKSVEKTLFSTKFVKVDFYLQFSMLTMLQLMDYRQNICKKRKQKRTSSKLKGNEKRTIVLLCIHPGTWSTWEKTTEGRKGENLYIS